MKNRAWLRWSLGGLMAVAWWSRAEAEEPAPPVLIAPGDLKWLDGGPDLPGVKVAILQGDPGKAALFVLRARLPANYRLAPHWHASDENVTVMSGTIFVGQGPTLDVSTARPVPAGGFFSMPAQRDHYIFTRTETVIQLTAVGPFGIMYVHPEDDPAKTAAVANSSAPAPRMLLHKAAKIGR